jgi:hypothetical protein
MTRSGDKIRWAVAAIMRKCGQQVALSNGRAVVERWQQIRSNPRTADIEKKRSGVLLLQQQLVLQYQHLHHQHQ